MDQENHGLIFSGDILVRNLDIPGSSFYRIFNTTKLEFTPSVESKVRESREKGKNGAALDEVKRKKPTEMSMTGDTFNKRNFAMSLGGIASDLDTAVKAIVDEKHTANGGAIDLAKEGVNAEAVEIKDSAAAVIDKSKYNVIENLGMIEPLDGFPDSGELKINYSTKASKGYSILADKLSGFNFEMKGDGLNEVTGENVRLYVPKASLSSDGAIDWFSDDFNSFSMKGPAIYDDKIKSTYKVDVISYE